MPRFLSCVNGDADSLKLAWLFMFTIPGAPCIYYGDEVGLDGGHDPECRRAFPWEKSKWDRDLLESVKALIKLRTDHAALRKGTYRRLFSNGAVMAYARSHKNEDTIVAFNVSNEEKTVELALPGKPRILFGRPKISGNQVTLPPRSGVVIK
jgi:neopullulanase